MTSLTLRLPFSVVKTRLAGTLTGAGEATATLTSAMALSAAAVGSGLAVAALTTAIFLAGSISGSGLATANLTADSNVYLPTVGTAPTGVYSLSKMVSGYSGAAVNVRRSSDNATQDIGFTGQGLNLDAAVAFAAGATLYITKMYNQDGAGKDLTQTVAANQPILKLDAGHPSVMVNNTGIAKWLDIPTTITADRQNCTMLAVAADQHQAVTEGLFAMGVTGTIDLGVFGQPVSSNSAQAYADGSNISVAGADGSTVSTASPCILGIVSAASGITVHRDGLTKTSAAVTSRSMVSGGFLGKAHTSGKANIFAFVFYPAALGTSDVNAVKASLKLIHNTNATSGAVNISMFGDSKTYGVTTPNNLTITYLLRELYNNPAYIFRNRAISGQTLAGKTNNYVGNTGIEATGVNMIVQAYGTNDLSNVGNRTADQLWADCQALIASARGVGYTRFVGVTLTPRTISGAGWTSGMEAERIKYNARLIANDGGLFDGIANYNTIAALGTDGAPNLTYFPDGLHETEAAYILEAPVLKAAIDTAIAALLKPSCTTTPTLSGGTGVGEVMACSTGVWGNSPTGYTYQWFYADTLADINGANASARTLISADVGHTLACRVTAVNANGSSATKTLPTVVVTPSSLAISGTPAGGTQGAAYSFMPTTTGGETPYTYSLLTGTLPSGMSLNMSTGEVTGPPTGTGTSAFTLRVTDALSNTADLSTSITVSAAASYLLDGLTAAPVAAFSTTRLKASYTGPVVRAHRDSDNAAGDVAFDASGVLSGTSIITITSVGTSAYSVGQTMAFSTFYASTTVRVGTWYDQSGNGKSFSQATQASMPVIVASGVLAAKNGVATVDFSGNTAYVLPTSTIPAAPTAAMRTVSAVVSRESTTASTLLGPTAAGGIEFILQNALNRLQRAFGGTSADSTVAMTISTLVAILMAWDGTNYKHIIAGASAGSGATAAATFTGTATLKLGSGTNFARSKISEVIIFDTAAALSSGDETALHTSQAARFVVA